MNTVTQALPPVPNPIKSIKSRKQHPRISRLVIDYLYHLPEPKPDEGKLTQWKSQLVDKRKSFNKMFKARIGEKYLVDFEHDFSRTRDWVERLIAEEVNDLLADKLRSEKKNFVRVC